MPAAPTTWATSCSSPSCSSADSPPSQRRWSLPPEIADWSRWRSLPWGISRMRAWALWLLLACLAWQLPARAQKPPRSPPPGRRRGRKALRKGGFNWYDSTKRLRRINVTPPLDPIPAGHHPRRHTGPGRTGTCRWGLASSSCGSSCSLVGGLAYLLIMAYLQREASQAVASRRAGRRIRRSHPHRGPAGGRPTTGDLLSAARRAFEAGNYRDAIVFLYSHQLVQLTAGR